MECSVIAEAVESLNANNEDFHDIFAVMSGKIARRQQLITRRPSLKAVRNLIMESEITGSPMSTKAAFNMYGIQQAGLVIRS